MDGINFFYQGSGIKILGKMGLRDQNNGKEIGISGPRIYHVTTLRTSRRRERPLLAGKVITTNGQQFLGFTVAFFEKLSRK